MSWLFYVVLATSFFTIINLIQRVIADGSENPRATAVIFGGISGVLAILVFLISGEAKEFVIPTAPSAWLGLLGGVIFYGLYERGRFLANKYLDASVFAIVVNLSVLIAFIGAVFLYAEQLTLETLSGGLLVIFALLLVSYEKQRRQLSKKGLWITIAISVSLGLAWTLDKMGALNFGAGFYSMTLWTVPMIMVIFPLIPMKTLKIEFNRSGKKVSLIAVLNVLGYFLMLKALEIADATKVIPMVQTSLLLTVFLGIILLKERERLAQKIIAGIMGVIGVFLLV